MPPKSCTVFLFFCYSDYTGFILKQKSIGRSEEKYVVVNIDNLLYKGTELGTTCEVVQLPNVVDVTFHLLRKKTH